MPADAVPGSTIPEDTAAEIQLRDGTWVWARVIGQRKDRNGRWCVGIQYYPSPSIGESGGWYILDRRYVRRPDGLVGGYTAGQHRRRRLDSRNYRPGADRPPSGPQADLP